MSIIVIDGPEKAGKTTIINRLVQEYEGYGLKVIYRHWGIMDPDDRLYSPVMEKDAGTQDYLAIWDRCWPSEFVYGTLGMHGNVGHRMASDPWLGEWLHGRAVQANGLRVMILADSAAVLATKRDSSDMPVDPAMERKLYKEYAQRFGWLIIANSHTTCGTSDSVFAIMRAYSDATSVLFALPPHYCGAPLAKVVVVGEVRGEKKGIPGSWLPFTSRMTTELGRMFGDKAMQVGWTNAHDCPPVALAHAETIVACGKVATLWVENYAKKGGQRIISIPHPSYLFRFNNRAIAQKRESVTQIINQLVKEI